MRTVARTTHTFSCPASHPSSHQFAWSSRCQTATPAPGSESYRDSGEEKVRWGVRIFQQWGQRGNWLVPWYPGRLVPRYRSTGVGVLPKVTTPVTVYRTVT